MESLTKKKNCTDIWIIYCTILLLLRRFDRKSSITWPIWIDDHNAIFVTPGNTDARLRDSLSYLSSFWWFSKISLYNLTEKEGSVKDEVTLQTKNQIEPIVSLENSNSEGSSASLSKGKLENIPQRPPGSVPRNSRPASARNLSAVLKKEAKISLESSVSSDPASSEGKDDVLQTVKFKQETLSTMQNKKKEILQNSTSGNEKKDDIGHLVGQALSKVNLDYLSFFLLKSLLTF